jgi:hypothetical protein
LIYVTFYSPRLWEEEVTYHSNVVRHREDESINEICSEVLFRGITITM